MSELRVVHQSARGQRDVSSPEAVTRIWREASEQVRKEESSRVRRALKSKKVSFGFVGS